MRQILVVADLQVAVGVVVEPLLQLPEVLVDAVLGARAEQHELRVVLQRVEQRVADQVQALLRVEPPDIAQDRAWARRSSKRSRSASLFTDFSSTLAAV